MVIRGRPFDGELFDGIHPDLQSQVSPSQVGHPTNKWDELHAQSGSIDTVSSDHVIAVSGSFPSGIVLTDTNGSGWLVGVSILGELTTTGPITLE